MMKKIIFLVLTLTLYSSCVDQLSSDVRFTIYNQTDKEVTVSGFSTKVISGGGGRGIANPILIAPQSSFTAVRMNGVDDTTGMRYYSTQGGSRVDSVRVVFEDNKLLVYTSKEFPNKKVTSILDGEYVKKDHYAHYITMEDYTLAVDCGEECF